MVRGGYLGQLEIKQNGYKKHTTLAILQTKPEKLTES